MKKYKKGQPGALLVRGNLVVGVTFQGPWQEAKSVGQLFSLGLCVFFLQAVWLSSALLPLRERLPGEMETHLTLLIKL